MTDVSADIVDAIKVIFNSKSNFEDKENNKQFILTTERSQIIKVFEYIIKNYVLSLAKLPFLSSLIKESNAIEEIQVLLRTLEDSDNSTLFFNLYMIYKHSI